MQDAFGIEKAFNPIKAVKALKPVKLTGEQRLTQNWRVNHQIAAGMHNQRVNGGLPVGGSLRGLGWQEPVPWKAPRSKP